MDSEPDCPESPEPLTFSGGVQERGGLNHPRRESEQNRQGLLHAKTHNEPGGGGCFSGRRVQVGYGRIGAGSQHDVINTAGREERRGCHTVLQDH